MINKINEIKKFLGSIYLEREHIIHGLLTAFVARQHVLLVGPPGTAKSALVADLAKCITGTNYFQWLLTRFSTPEELFGPVSLKGLEQDTYKRNTHGKLPEAHIGFVDEIFKANSAILNALLTLANERLFYNNGGIVQSPLFSLVGASNEWPEEGEGLEALFDRFLFRYEVGNIADGNNFILMLQSNVPAQRPTISLEELEQLQMQAEMMTTVPLDVLDALRETRDNLKVEGIRPSDRRFRQCLSLLKAAAVLDGRDFVKRKDLAILSDVLWVTPEKNEREIVRRVVTDLALDPVEKELAQIMDVTNELMVELGAALPEIKNSQGADAAQKALEYNTKLKGLKEQVALLPDRDDIKESKQNILQKIDDSMKLVKTAMLGV
jgi:MoxR-like ATPase